MAAIPFVTWITGDVQTKISGVNWIYEYFEITNRLPIVEVFLILTKVPVMIFNTGNVHVRKYLYLMT